MQLQKEFGKVLMRGMYHMIRKRKENTIVGDMILSLLISYIITVAGILLIALCLLLFRLSMHQVERMLFLLYLLSSFFGGIRMGKRKKGNSFFEGMALGAVYYSCFLLMSYFQKITEQEGILQRICMMIFMIVFGGIGGFLGKRLSYIRQRKSFMLYCSNVTIGKKKKILYNIKYRI